MNSKAFRTHPIDAVAAILPDEQHVKEAVEALRAEGVDVSEIEERHGAEGIRDLDRAGTEHGWKARLIRLWQNWTYYEQILLLYTEDMRRGESLILVPALLEERNRIGRILAAHKGHGIYYFGFERVESLSGP